MNVLLVAGPTTENTWSTNLTGLFSIAAYCKTKTDAIFNIIELNSIEYSNSLRNSSKYMSMRKYVDLIDFVPDIIGVSSSFDINNENYYIIKMLKEIYPKAFYTIGGYATTEHYSEYIEYVDAVCWGEGELPFLNLLLSFKDHNVFDYLNKSDSWIIKGKKFDPKSELIYNLDDIPSFDLDILKGINISQKIFSINPERSCANNCPFCNLIRAPVRRISIEKLEKDILYYYEKYNIYMYIFLADAIFSDPCYWEKVLLIFKKYRFLTLINIGMYLIGKLEEKHIRLITEVTYNRTIHLPIDSVNKRLYKIIKGSTHIPLEKFIEINKIFLKYNFIVVYQAIVGYPGEYIWESIKVLKFLKSLGARNYSLSPFRYYKNSPIYKKNKPSNFRINIRHRYSTFIAKLIEIINMRFYPLIEKNYNFYKLMNSNTEIMVKTSNQMLSSSILYYISCRHLNIPMEKDIQYRIQEYLNSIGIFTVLLFLIFGRFSFSFLKYYIKIVNMHK